LSLPAPDGERLAVQAAAKCWIESAIKRKAVEVIRPK
jgi:hypothetical protein